MPRRRGAPRRAPARPARRGRPRSPKLAGVHEITSAEAERLFPPYLDAVERLVDATWTDGALGDGHRSMAHGVRRWRRRSSHHSRQRSAVSPVRRRDPSSRCVYWRRAQPPDLPGAHRAGQRLRERHRCRERGGDGPDDPRAAGSDRRRRGRRDGADDRAVRRHPRDYAVKLFENHGTRHRAEGQGQRPADPAGAQGAARVESRSATTSSSGSPTASPAKPAAT